MIAGGLAAVIALGGTGFFLGRSTAPQPARPAPVVIAAPSPAPTAELPEILGREQLIQLAAIASDAKASGDALPESATATVGRRFEIVLPFGCSGPSSPDTGPAMRWSYDEQTETLRVTANPNTWKTRDWGEDETAGDRPVEGFWISRPWTRDDGCPPPYAPIAPSGMEAITLPGQTLGIGQIFSGDANRDARRGDRPYEIVKRVPAEKVQGSGGFRLRLTGRIAAVADGLPIRCVQPAGPEQRPVCLIAARMDEVSLENPRTGERLATWRSGIVK